MGVRDTFIGGAVVQAAVEAVVTSDCIKFHLDDTGRIHFSLDSRRAPHMLRALVDHLADAGPSATLEVLVQGHAYHEGLKVVSLSQLDAEALENTQLNFSVADYSQPFPTLFVDLPPSFFLNH